MDYRACSDNARPHVQQDKHSSIHAGSLSEERARGAGTSANDPRARLRKLHRSAVSGMIQSQERFCAQRSLPFLAPVLRPDTTEADLDLVRFVVHGRTLMRPGPCRMAASAALASLPFVTGHWRRETESGGEDIVCTPPPNATPRISNVWSGLLASGSSGRSLSSYLRALHLPPSPRTSSPQSTSLESSSMRTYSPSTSSQSSFPRSSPRTSSHRVFFSRVVS